MFRCWKRSCPDQLQNLDAAIRTLVSAMIGMLAGIEQPDRFAAHVMVGPSPCYINDGEYVGGFSRSDIDQPRSRSILLASPS
jgi:hypothetical protein